MGADWLSAFENVGGRLVPAARVFVDSEPPPRPSTGAPGIRWLATRLEDFVDRDTTDIEDDRFVEGAGALLGLLLIEHLGGRIRERGGSHRVQLGRFGWFDPFAAVHDALDAEDPRRCLADRITLAEQEAAARGPVSRVVHAFAEVLRRERPDLDIVSHFELTVDLDNGASVDLSRLERVARDQDDGATHDAARRIISMLPGADGAEQTSWQEAVPRLLPRLVSSEFLRALPIDQELHTETLGSGVHVAFQLRYGNRARYVRASEVRAWSTDEATVERQAIENLVAKSRSLRLEPAAPGVLRVRQGDGLDGARLLLPDLESRLVQVSRAPWVGAAPHRDVLLLAPRERIAELEAEAEELARRAPHPVSASVFALTEHGPRPWPSG